MKKVILVFVVVLVTLFSCKIDKKEDKKANEVEDVKKKEKLLDNVIVKIYIEYLNDDHIRLFYLEDPNEKVFIGENSFRKEIIGKEGIQEVVFELPKDRYLGRIRIDFGSNSNLGTIKISKILISRKNDLITVDQNNFNDYFWLNSNVSTFNYYQFELSIDKKHYDPFIISRLLLNDELVFL